MKQLLSLFFLFLFGSILFGQSNNLYDINVELIQEDKQFEWMIYPDKNHGIYGGNTSIHLYNKMTIFIEENL